MFNINNVGSAHPEEGLRDGRNVRNSVLESIYLHEIYLKLQLKTLDTEEHHAGTEVVRS